MIKLPQTQLNSKYNLSKTFYFFKNWILNFWGFFNQCSSWPLLTDVPIIHRCGSGQCPGGTGYPVTLSPWSLSHSLCLVSWAALWWVTGGSHAHNITILTPVWVQTWASTVITSHVWFSFYIFSLLSFKSIKRFSKNNNY